jgi:hypothetical protein
MGSWGYGLRDNDSAADAIDHFQNFSNISLIFNKIKKDGNAVLGLADFLLKRKVDLKKVRTVIITSLEKELRPAVLRQWDSPAEREYALTFFKSRLLGLPKPKKLKQRPQTRRPTLKAREKKANGGL